MTMIVPEEYHPAATQTPDCAIDTSCCDIEFHTNIITPTSSCDTTSNENTSSEICLKEQLREAQLDAKKSAEALEDFVAGIRAVKRILDRHTLPQDKSNNSEDQDLLSQLSAKLPGVLGSDLSALANAANMAQEHAKLASEEASELVSDIHTATKEREMAEDRAQKAGKVSRKLYRQNEKLQQAVVRIKGERRALIKEVKTLRQEKEETSKFDSWRLLEEHVMDSMSIHETIMKAPNSETSATSDPAESNQKHHPKKIHNSQLPSLEDATASCSEDSLTYAHDCNGEIEACDLSSNDGGNNSMPANVSLNKQPRPPSPLVTPPLSPSGVASPELKPYCDPNILRTLAIPSRRESSHVDSKGKYPSQRERPEEPGLYEC